MHYLTACDFIFSHFGAENQKRKLQEECAELIRAIARNDEQNMFEEMADVLILLDQFRMNNKIYKKIDEIKQKKVDRTIQRIEQE